MRTVLTCILCVCLFPLFAFAEVPKTLAGITLGDSVEKYQAIILADTMMGNRDALFLDEVDIDPSKFKGIRGGSISSGNCNAPGKILGIKLKFTDRSFALYEALEKAYRKDFGEPAEWLGDAFHNVIAWKWVKKEGDDVVEIVLTYSKDPEIRPGVSIKIVLRSQWLRELKTYKAKQAKRKKHRYMKGDYSPEKLAPFIPQ